VIYCLHGMGESQRACSWIVELAGKAMREGRMNPTIIVIPQAMPQGYYMNGNTADPKVVTGPIEDVLIHDLLPFVDGNYRTVARREGRGLEGFSMGGRGALYLGFRHPDLFCAISSVSGAVVSWEEEHMKWALEGSCGDLDNPASKAYFDANNPLVFARENEKEIRRQGTWIRFYVGNQDHLQPIVTRFTENIKALDIPFTFKVVPGAHHRPFEVFDEQVNKYDPTFWNIAFSGKKAAPALTIESDILGLCDTGNKTTLKKVLAYTHGPGDINLYHYDESGNRVVYENQKEIEVPLDPVRYTGRAVLQMKDVDDNLIDASGAVVRIVDGSGYYADEFVLKADRLTGEWKEGRCEYTLSEGDLEFNTWGYDTSRDFNSSREWSIMGGDGNGVYAFTFEVSGILYDGREVPPTTFPVAVYCYGRSCDDLALKTVFKENAFDSSWTSGLVPGKDVQWTWYTEGRESSQDKPYMNDMYTDYFSVVWPQGTDASTITAQDVTLTLSNRFGENYILSTENPYGEHEYTVQANKEETIIGVLYQQWAAVPVFSKLTIQVRRGMNVTTKTYDIASVAASMTMTGGGGVDADHTLTCYNHHGILGMNMSNAVDASYTLSTQIDGKTYYYAEDPQGKGYLSEAVSMGGPRGMMGPDGGPGGQGGPGGGMMGRGGKAPQDAWHGDGTDIFNVAVHGNVIFIETRTEPEVLTETKVVDGKKISFTRKLGGNLQAGDMLAKGATLDEGYNTVRGGAAQWAWTMRYQAGWTRLDKQPSSLPYVNGIPPYGFLPSHPKESYMKLSSEH